MKENSLEVLDPVVPVSKTPDFRRFHSQWVVSKPFDLIFFLTPTLLSAGFLCAMTLFPQSVFFLTVFLWLAFAQSHFGSTWAVYFDRVNRDYYRQHKFTFYVMPVLLFTGALVLGYYQPAILFFLVPVASFYHVTKQSIGILQLYRIRNKEFSLLERKVETLILFAWGLFFTGCGVTSIDLFNPYLKNFLPVVLAGLALLFTAAAAGTAFILFHLYKRSENSIQKNIFLLVSILLYSPYLYTPGIINRTNLFEIATLTSLIPHYMQYVGLVWLINRNKYKPGTKYAEGNGFLSSVSQDFKKIGLWIFGYGAVMTLLYWFPPAAGNKLPVFLRNIVLASLVIHFYIDAFIWRFRNPFIKETVLPFIRPAAGKS